MNDMPRPRPPYLQRQTNRHGKAVWYVRIRPNPRVRIRGEYGTPEFTAAYQAALKGKTVEVPDAKVPAGSLSWLLARYRETNAWRDLSMAMRRQRENIFLHVLEASGREPFTAVNRKSVTAGRD